MDFQARNNFVVLLLDDRGELESPGGVVLPVFRRIPPDFGEVVSVGEGKWYGTKLIPIPLEVGQIVYFDKLVAHGIMIDDIEYVYLDASGVLAIKED